jgi:hypothetical protein
MKVPIVGGIATTLASGQSGPGNLTTGGIAVDATNVYWLNAGVLFEQNGSVMSIPLGGGTAAMFASAQETPESIAVDATNVYWTSYAYGPVMMSISGGTPTTLADAYGTESGSMAIDTSNVYWTNPLWVLKIPIVGGTPTILTSAYNNPEGIAVDGTNLYWTDLYDGLLEMPIAGGAVTTLAPGPYSAYSVAVDATGVYWADGDVMQRPIAGGTATTLASANAQFIALDNTSVYWTDLTTVMKVQKPFASGPKPVVPPTLPSVTCATPLEVLVGASSQSWPTYLQTAVDVTVGSYGVSSYEWCWSTSSTGCATAGFPGVSTSILYTGPPGWIGALGANVSGVEGPGTFGTALAPNTTYWVSAVAVDTAGNTSLVAQSASCTTAVSAVTNIYPIFANDGCNMAACHSGTPTTQPGPFGKAFFSSPPPLTSPYNACSGESFIVPNSAAQSLIYATMTGGNGGSLCGATAMPLGGTLDTAGAALIELWINQGANFVQ